MTHLGLVCLTSPNAPKSDRIAFRTITRTSYLKLTRKEQITKLTSIYNDNATMLSHAIRYSHRNGIRLYRMMTGMFPFADLPENTDLMPAVALASAGALAVALDVRLISHPDQFCVLSSDKPHVITNSIAMLTLEALQFDLIGLPRSQWAAINVHIGRKGKDACDTIVSVIADLDPAISSRLTLENDEDKQDAEATWDVCDRAGVAMLFDFHHELVAHKLNSYDHPRLKTFVHVAATTWEDSYGAVVHLSNGAAHLHDKKHADLITVRPSDLQSVQWLELEAKGKEQAIAAFPKV